jgi:hypothetical protein
LAKGRALPYEEINLEKSTNQGGSTFLWKVPHSRW